MDNSLYDRDFNLWIEKTASLLEKRQFSDLDLENLIEEIKSMGKSDRRSLESYLLKLFEHLLKLQYWKSELVYNERGWRNEVRNFRRSIKRILADSPSLKPYLAEIFDDCFQEARISFIDLSGIEENLVSSIPVATLDRILDENWFPDSKNFEK